MSIWNIVIGTGILWLLTGLVVLPIARLLTNSRAKGLGQSQVSGQGTLAETQAEPEIATGYYILVDILVLGIAGLIMGWVLGWFFIGITWQAKSIPGMIVFIAASIIGSMMHG